MPPVFGPGVAVADPLVVLRRRERHHRAAVGERHERDLLAGEELLDHDARAGVAERAPHHHLVEAGARGREVVADQHALAGREPVGLDDDRRAELVERSGARRRDR